MLLCEVLGEASMGSCALNMFSEKLALAWSKAVMVAQSLYGEKQDPHISGQIGNY